MSRAHTATQPCGCKIVHEPISRSVFIRERWADLCPTHDAEEKAYRAEAQRGHEIATRARALLEEFT